jgi:type VI secretion system secreted protein Hcp
MGFDAFLKIDGIKGESQDSKHKGEIDIMSFSWGATQAGTYGTGGGGGAGKVSVQDFLIVKKVDCSTPLLFLNCANGAHIKEANFVVRKAGGTQLEYLKYKFSDVLISGVKPHGEAAHVVSPRDVATGQASGRRYETGGDEIPLEEVTLNFAKVEISYQPQSSTGAAQGGPVLAGWDVKANQKV